MIMIIDDLDDPDDKGGLSEGHPSTPLMSFKLDDSKDLDDFNDLDKHDDPDDKGGLSEGHPCV